MNSIQRLFEKIKGFTPFRAQNVGALSDDVFLVIVIILVAFGSFGLGRLSKIEGAKTPIRIENMPESTEDTFSQKAQSATKTSQTASVINTQATDLVGSKNGTKYYYSWCTGVQKILPANLIHFADKAEAEARGYTASATCKGL